MRIDVMQRAFWWTRGSKTVKPATPRLNGKVERSHRIDDEEFYRMLDGVVVDNTQLFNLKLQEWEHFYNFERPHGGLGGRTPYERLRERTQAPAVSGQRQSNIGGAEGIRTPDLLPARQTRSQLRHGPTLRRK
jgi:hypothetical protein